MEGSVRKTVVVSAVNIRKGGTLTILKDCLKYLSELSLMHPGEYRIVALVHARLGFGGIEYIEMPDVAKNWGRRLWCEYVTMNRISRRLADEDGRKVWLWLSLHDTSPRVSAEHHEVYCQTSFPFLKLKLRDLWMDPKVVLFTLFTKYAYKVNVHCNDCLIVQQNWFRDALSNLIGFPADKIRVIPPVMPDMESVVPADISYDVPMFFYASTPDCHKNFETLCSAAENLERISGAGKFRIVLTVSGNENRYAAWLRRKWGHVSSIDFHGFMSKEELFGHYRAADAFVFPSRIETWGLPISEFKTLGSGRLLLNDLPYAHESAGDYENVAYFRNADELTQLLKEMI